MNAKVAGILGELLAISPFDLKKVYEIWVFQDVHNTYARVHMVLVPENQLLDFTRHWCQLTELSGSWYNIVEFNN